MSLHRARPRHRGRRALWVGIAVVCAAAVVAVWANRSPDGATNLSASVAQTVRGALRSHDGKGAAALSSDGVIALRGGVAHPTSVAFVSAAGGLWEASLSWGSGGVRVTTERPLATEDSVVVQGLSAIDSRMVLLIAVEGQVQALQVVSPQGRILQTFALRPSGVRATVAPTAGGASVQWETTVGSARSATLRDGGGVFTSLDPSVLSPVTATRQRHNLFIVVVEKTRQVLGPRPVALTEDVWYTVIDALRRLRATIDPHLVSAVGSLSTGQSASVSSATPPVTPVAAPVTVTLPRAWAAATGEGVWVPTGPQGASGPTMAQTFLLPNPARPGDRVDLVWMSARDLRFHLVAGTQHPQAASGIRGTGVVPTSVLSSLVAAFNGNFKRVQGQYGGFGFVAGGEVYNPPRAGLATFAVYPGGQLAIGTWGTEILSSPAPVGLLQNLTLIVDSGQAVAQTGNDAAWGIVVGNSVHVWRSALGITTSGDLIYAAGPSLTAQELADALVAAGASRAMELDINSYWVTFNLYTPSAAGGVTGRKLISTMVRPADRYIASPDSRDFVYVTDPALVAPS